MNSKICSKILVCFMYCELLFLFSCVYGQDNWPRLKSKSCSIIEYIKSQSMIPRNKSRLSDSVISTTETVPNIIKNSSSKIEIETDGFPGEASPRFCIEIKQFSSSVIAGYPTLIELKQTVVRASRGLHSLLPVIHETQIEFYWHYTDKNKNPHLIKTYHAKHSHSVWDTYTINCDNYGYADYVLGDNYNTYYMIPTLYPDSEGETIRLICRLKYNKYLCVEYKQCPPIESSVIGEDNKALSYNEFQNLFLFSQKENCNEEFYPIYDWYLPYHLSNDTIKFLCDASRDGDLLSSLLIYKYYYCAQSYRIPLKLGQPLEKKIITFTNILKNFVKAPEDCKRILFFCLYNDFLRYYDLHSEKSRMLFEQQTEYVPANTKEYFSDNDDFFSKLIIKLLAQHNYLDTKRVNTKE